MIVHPFIRPSTCQFSNILPKPMPIPRSVAEYAEEWFINIDKWINYVNANTSIHGVNMFYSTPQVRDRRSDSGDCDELTEDERVPLV